MRLQTPGKLLGLVLLVCVGCGTNDGTFPVTGTVTLSNGEPFNEGKVQFTSSQGKRFSTSVKPDGSFQLRKTANANGLEPGEYKVVVQEINFDDLDRLPVPKIHPKYRTEKTTDLQVTVKEESNDYELTLDPVPSRR